MKIKKWTVHLNGQRHTVAGDCDGHLEIHISHEDRAVDPFRPLAPELHDSRDGTRQIGVVDGRGCSAGIALDRGDLGSGIAHTDDDEVIVGGHGHSVGQARRWRGILP